MNSDQQRWMRIANHLFEQRRICAIVMPLSEGGGILIPVSQGDLHIAYHFFNCNGVICFNREDADRTENSCPDLYVGDQMRRYFYGKNEEIAQWIGEEISRDLKSLI
jgi:hypothetical protein